MRKVIPSETLGFEENEILDYTKSLGLTAVTAIPAIQRVEYVDVVEALARVAVLRRLPQRRDR